MHRSHKQIKKSERSYSQTHDVPIDIIGKSFRIAFPLHRFITEKSLGIPNIQAIQVTIASSHNSNQVEVSILATVGSRKIQTKALHHNAYSAAIAAFKTLRTLANKHQAKTSGRKKHRTSLSENEQTILNQKTKAPRASDT